jgi:hypothetical protein
MPVKMRTDITSKKARLPGALSEYPVLSALTGRAYSPQHPAFKKRRGQTAVEYLLVTLALTVAFSLFYGMLQGYLKQTFEAGGKIVLQTRKPTRP